MEAEDSIEYKEALINLSERAAVLANLHGWNETTFEQIQGLCDDAVINAKSRGVELPAMVVARFYPSLVIRIYRKDASPDHVHNYIVELIRERLGVTPKELFEGFKRAYPNFKKDLTDQVRALDKTVRNTKH